jgi:hypothetical protein
MITVVSLAFDPLVQQVLAYSERTSFSHEPSALLKRVDYYTDYSTYVDLFIQRT